jgi:ribonuclease T2
MAAMKKHLMIFLAGMAVAAGVASAQVKLDGSFVAAKDCPAVQSIKKRTNPGNVSITNGQSYKLLGKNREQASHYWISVPGAVPEQRWVEVDCGSANGGVVAAPTSAKPMRPAQAGGDFYILALTWQPAFCEAHSDKKECKFASADAYEAKNFALHGLWPQPRSNVLCGVSVADKVADDNHRWESLPVPQISGATKVALDKVMPGTQSFLERHEFIKHGTCYPASADQYFKDAARLVEAVNASPVQALVSANIGKTIKTADLRAAFDAGFGAGAGVRVRVACDRDKDRLLITEITIGLKGDIPGGAALGELMLASTPTDAGCPAGVIDPAGRE